MTLKKLNELVKDFNEEKACIRIGKNWDMTIYPNAHVYVEAYCDNFRVRNEFLGLIILNIFDFMDYNIEKLRNGDYQIYKKGE